MLPLPRHAFCVFQNVRLPYRGGSRSYDVFSGYGKGSHVLCWRGETYHFFMNTMQRKDSGMICQCTVLDKYKKMIVKNSITLLLWIKR